MSEFPKSYRWHADPTDVITFQSADDVPRCNRGMSWQWSYMHLVTSPTKWVPITIHDELTALRRFRAAVMQATQTESNSRLPMAIFAADAEVRRVIKPEVSHV